MIYKVFNPLAGQHVDAQSFEEAKAVRLQLIENYFKANHIAQGLRRENVDLNTKAIATQFIVIKTGIPEVTYNYSVYNATTKEYLSDVFAAVDAENSYLIKVSNGEVTEWYHQNQVYNGVKHLYLSLDVNTDEVLEYYDLISPSLMHKFLLDGTFVVATQMGNYSSIPADKTSMLDDFEFKEWITAWSDKSYGFCIEFDKARYVPYADCTAEEKANFDAEKTNFIKTTTLFPVNTETVLENGDTLWGIVDVSIFND